MGTRTAANRIDLVLAKVRLGMWEEAIEDAKNLPYFNASLKTDLEVMRSVYERIRTPQEDLPVSVKAKTAVPSENNEDEDGEEEDLSDYYYMGFNIYGIWPNDVEENGINLMAAMLYDERMTMRTNTLHSEETNRVIEEVIKENKEFIEVYRGLRKEGKGPEEAKRLARLEIYKRRAKEDGFEELPF